MSFKEKEIAIGRIKHPYPQSSISLEATVELEIENKEKGLVFSISGNVWNSRHSDIIEGGQTLDTFKAALANTIGCRRGRPKNKEEAYFRTLLVDREDLEQLFSFWERWHLNDLHAGCEHQRKENWGTEKITLYRYQMNTEMFNKQRAIQKKAEEQLANKGTVTVTKEEQEILNLPYTMEVTEEKIRELPALLKNYEEKSKDTKTSSWIYPTQHPRGVLTKPCPVCGYKFGTAWKMEPLPQTVIDWLNNFVNQYDKE